MKVLIPIVIGLLVVGCGKDKQSTNTNESNNTPVKPAKKKAEKETPSNTLADKKKPSEKQLDWGSSGTVDGDYQFGQLVKGKITKLSYSFAFVGLEHDMDAFVAITQISEDLVDKIEDSLKVGQEVKARVLTIGRTNHRIYLSIKGAIYDEHQLKKEREVFDQWLIVRDRVVGTYELELKKFGETQRYVLLDNSIVEYYLNDKKEAADHKWSIDLFGEEVHIERENRAVSVFSINKDESITGIATIDEDGKRKEILKEHQYTRKKIK